MTPIELFRRRLRQPRDVPEVPKIPECDVTLHTTGTHPLLDAPLSSSHTRDATLHSGNTAIPLGLECDKCDTAAADWLTGSAAALAIRRALAGRGGVVIRSRILGGRQLLFVRDETIPIPEQYLTLVRFTLAELAQIVTERWSPDRLAEVVRAKEIFGGTVVVDPEAAPSDARSAERQHVLDLAAARDWPMVPLRSGLDIHGTDLAWRAFARSAPPGDLLAARTYLDYLPLPAQEAGENGKPR